MTTEVDAVLRHEVKDDSLAAEEVLAGHHLHRQVHFPDQLARPNKLAAKIR